VAGRHIESRSDYSRGRTFAFSILPFGPSQILDGHKVQPNLDLWLADQVYYDLDPALRKSKVSGSIQYIAPWSGDAESLGLKTALISEHNENKILGCDCLTV
jgi:hypothetical protein